MSTAEWVSVHGGHSGQFCNHAADTLEEVVSAYAQQGFAWAGVTEHMPPASDLFLFPEEKRAGLDAEKMYRRFERYMQTARRLQERFVGRIELLVAFETETCSGSIPLVRELQARFGPDYIVGSVHHVRDVPFDYSPETYREAERAAGGMEALYCEYFDRQFEMIEQLQPAVVGHLDLVRIFDSDYRRRLRMPAVARRVRRNLERIHALDLILDFNLRALYHGAQEPYVCGPILALAGEMGITVVPGDDSHGVETVGRYMAEGIGRLQEAGFDTHWSRPARQTGGGVVR